MEIISEISEIMLNVFQGMLYIILFCFLFKAWRSNSNFLSDFLKKFVDAENVELKVDEKGAVTLSATKESYQDVPVDKSSVEDGEWANENHGVNAGETDPAAQFYLGRMYFDGEGVDKDYQEAAKWYHKAAEQGEVRAQNNLGVMYANGEGVDQDYEEAVRLYGAAAEKGVAFAQSNLGVMYAEGRGVDQDYKKAEKWYRKAAEQGNAFAQRNLGILYAEGRGIPLDYVHGYMWFNLAAASGDDIAELFRDQLAEDEMTDEQIANAQELSSEWFERYGKSENKKLSDENFSSA